MNGGVLVWAVGDDAASAGYVRANLDALRRGAATSGATATWVVDDGRAVAERWEHGVAMGEVEDLGDVNMGDPRALARWIDQAAGVRGPEGVLVVSGHGTGWTGVASAPRRRVTGDREPVDGGPYGLVAVDETFGDALDTVELVSVLSPRFTDGPLALLGFDACFMASLDLFAHLGRFARVMVGSAYEAPASGWRYDHVLDAYVRAAGAEALGRALVEDVGARWGTPPPGKVAHLVAVSGPGVVAAGEALHALGAAALRDGARLTTAALAALPGFGSPAPCFDVAHVADLLARLGGPGSATAEAAHHLQACVDACVLASVSHPRVHPTGLPVYLGNPAYEAVSPDYLRLVGPDSGWGRYITSLWSP